MINQAKQMINIGVKIKSNGSKGSTISVFNNQIMHTNNMIIAGNDDKKYLFITHSNPNFLSSDDPGIIQHTLEWMNKLIKYSSVLDGNSSHDQHLNKSIFNILLEKIKSTQSKIEMLIERDKVIL